MLTLLLGLLALYLFCKWYTAIYRQWSDRGIPSCASFPFGTSKKFALFTEFQGHCLDTFYRKYAPHPYFGMFNMRQPFLVIRDPEIVKLVLAKEFSHFVDRQGFKLRKEDPLSHHLFNLGGEQWRALRVKLSPTFSSGKLKNMFQLFLASSQNLEKVILTKSDKPLAVKDLVTKFTTDVICSCAFGLEANAITDSESEIGKIATNFFRLSPVLRLALIVLRAFPFLSKVVNPTITPDYVKTFFTKLIHDTVEHREKTGQQRNDFLDLLIQLKNKGNLVDDKAAESVNGALNGTANPLEMTLDLLTAQCFIFLFAGYETSSSVMTYCFYELALNQEIQERLRSEINEKIKEHGGLTYQAIQDMEYLDMVISETMRKYPTLTYLTRRCTKDFKTPAGHVIREDDRIVIPVWSLHMDPAFFSEPEKFDPERFSKENKKNIVPFSYLPFGDGPRICIGSRFGLLQVKMGVITVLRCCSLEPDKNTEVPLKMSVNSLVLSTPEHPVVLKISPLASTNDTVS